MAKLITDALKELFTAQGVTATGDTIADVLKDGNTKAYSATVSGNQIADVISQTAETGTFSGGGAAPTVVDEITWDGDTTGLESATITLGHDPVTVYKVSDSVLPYALTSSPIIGYTINYSDGTSSGPEDNDIAAFDFFLTVGGSYDVVCAFFTGYENQMLGGDLVPSVGTWLKKNGGTYVSGVSVYTGE